MKRTIATFIHNGTYRVTYDDAEKINPYRVSYHWNELTDHGCRKRTKQLVRYADIGSCMMYLAQIVNFHG